MFDAKKKTQETWLIRKGSVSNNDLLRRGGLYWNTERRNAGTPERRNTKTWNTKLLKPGTQEK